MIVYTSGEWNKVDFASGTFYTRLFRIVPNCRFSPWVSWVSNVQFDTQSSVLGWQSRFRWILKPGNDLYVVDTHNWIDDPLRRQFETLDRRAATKALYTHRFPGRPPRAATRQTRKLRYGGEPCNETR